MSVLAAIGLLIAGYFVGHAIGQRQADKNWSLLFDRLLAVSERLLNRDDSDWWKGESE